MKAAVLEENKLVKIKDLDTPDIKENEVLVEVKYSGVCGSDMARLFSNGARFYPIVLGHEFSGLIAKVGNKVENIKLKPKREYPENTRVRA